MCCTANICLILQKYDKLFSKMTICNICIFPPAKYESSSYTVFLSTLVIISIFNFSTSSGYVIVSNVLSNVQTIHFLVANDGEHISWVYCAFVYVHWLKIYPDLLLSFGFYCLLIVWATYIFWIQVVRFMIYR